MESRISEIEGKLAEAEVVDPSKLSSDRIIFGATVTLLDSDSNEKVSYQIVGEDESDVKQGKISVFSPLARALIGKKADDVIELKTPKGEKEYEVIKFEFK
ncbi:MAG: transcription elongation factor GreA [Bdellovibrionales bacterium]